MTWEAPKTWTFAELVYADGGVSPPSGGLNQQLRDNMKYLKGQSGTIAHSDILQFAQKYMVGVDGSTDHIFRISQGDDTDMALKIHSLSATRKQLFVRDESYSPAWVEIFHAGRFAGGTHNHTHVLDSMGNGSSNFTTSWAFVAKGAGTATLSISGTTGPWLILAQVHVLYDGSTSPQDHTLQLRITDETAADVGPINVLSPTGYTNSDQRFCMLLAWYNTFASATNTLKIQLRKGGGAGSSQIFDSNVPNDRLIRFAAIPFT